MENHTDTPLTSSRIVSSAQETADSPDPNREAPVPKTQEVPRERRRLIVLCDGTWNNSDSDKPESNVGRLKNCLKGEELVGEQRYTQMKKYIRGIGTDTAGKYLDGARGTGIGRNIRDAYNYLCDSYGDDNDQIYLIGFSRGAFTARCVASLISDVGLLVRPTDETLRSVYRMWKDMTDSTDTKVRGKAEAALKNYCQKLGPDHLRSNVSIEACAVWDTVSALGVPGFERQRFVSVNSSLCKNIKRAYQALALDEFRSQFKPILWEKSTPEQVLKQCWFLGSHSDVGGGYRNCGYANISLVWMITQLSTLLAFDPDRIWQQTDNGRILDVKSTEQPVFRLSQRNDLDLSQRNDFDRLAQELQISDLPQNNGDGQASKPEKKHKGQIAIRRTKVHNWRRIIDLAACRLDCAPTRAPSKKKR